MSGWVRLLVLVTTVLAGAGPVGLAAAERFALGRSATPEEIAGWDIDVRPDGLGLPAGQGTAAEGEDLYQARCAACHGEFGEAVGRYPALMGGVGSLASADPVKTVGSYWPYASTVFDYVRRAMPFGHAQSLDTDQTYAMTAYLLYLNDLVDEDTVIDRNTLPAIEMPNRNGFIADDRPDVPGGEPCMTDCRGAPTIVGRARQIDVTPETEADAATSVAGPVVGNAQKGKSAFNLCVACHSLGAGEHRLGPSLSGILGRRSGTADGFAGYSTAMRSVGLEWTAANLRAFIESPSTLVAGTSMPFAGIRDAQVVADLVAFLREASTR